MADKFPPGGNEAYCAHTSYHPEQEYFSSSAVFALGCYPYDEGYNPHYPDKWNQKDSPSKVYSIISLVIKIL